MSPLRGLCNWNIDSYNHDMPSALFPTLIVIIKTCLQHFLHFSVFILENLPNCYLLKRKGQILILKKQKKIILINYGYFPDL